MIPIPKEGQCPNCGEEQVCLFVHNCVVAGDNEARLGIVHCGCFYEADPDEVECHVSRDCDCDGS